MAAPSCSLLRINIGKTLGSPALNPADVCAIHIAHVPKFFDVAMTQAASRARDDPESDFDGRRDIVGQAAKLEMI